MANTLKFFTNSVHRLVVGSVTDKVTKDRNNNNAPIPEDKQRYEFGVAMRKDDPDTIRVINEIHGFMAAEWANDQGKIAALNAYWSSGCEGVSLKIKDGDKPNSKGKLNENTTDCYVFYFSNWGGEPPRTVDAANQDIPGSAVKRGYYVQIAGQIKDNGEAYSTNPRQNRCGAYLDSDVIRLVAEGDVITGGIDAETAFGGTVATGIALPAGARPLGSGAPVGAPGAALPGVQQGVPAGAPGIPGNAPTGAPVQHQTDHVSTQTPGLPGQQGVPPQTASHINPPNGILTGLGGAAQPAGLPGMPGT